MTQLIAEAGPTWSGLRDVSHEVPAAAKRGYVSWTTPRPLRSTPLRLGGPGPLRVSRRKAWEPDEWPEGAQKAYILRNVDDPDEMIAFGFYEGDLTQRRAEPQMRELQRTRFERMARTSSRRGQTASTT